MIAGDSGHALVIQVFWEHAKVFSALAVRGATVCPTEHVVANPPLARRVTHCSYTTSALLSE